MKKYEINEEFKMYTKVKPRISKFIVSTIDKFLKTPKWLKNDKELDVKIKKIKGYKDKVELIIITPKSIKNDSPCLMYFHGGAFVINASEHHYKEAVIYAKSVPCIVVFVKYNLANNSSIITPSEDSYCALKWLLKNVDDYNINKRKIALAGDSAGGNISAVLCNMIRDRKLNFKPKFVMLIYPFLDHRLESKSSKKYVDTPMWNTNMSKKLIKIYDFYNTDIKDYSYVSPILGKDFNFPFSFYIESCEFDPLHDDAINYAKLLRNSNVDVTLNETKGTIHGFDMALSSTVTIVNLIKRIEYMKNKFYKTKKKSA